ncbi:MAG TPA: M23 family metallopeptidase [Gammaproteobacteria bacterium]|nr:M23 family metallopeptidase [Candidatus Hydrogenedentota bacterium]HJP36007.1 M23 family metallopeptidase [Gammaproteobacteria bacterium]
MKAGERVSHNTALGLVGTTGRSTGNHLHSEVRRGGTRIDPAPFFEEPPIFSERSGS